MKELLFSLRETARELWAERKRMALVVLGLVWGTLSLAVLVAFGDGFHDAMSGALRRGGDTMFRLYTGASSIPFQGLPAGRATPWTIRDLPAVRATAGVRAACLEFQDYGPVTVGDRVQNTNVLSVGPEYFDFLGMEMVRGGRPLSASDERERRRVAVIGERLAGRLFPSGEAVGRSVEVFGAHFIVVGVLAFQPRVMNWGGDDRDKVWIPCSTGIAMRGYTSANYALVQVEDVANARAVLAAVRALRAARHRCDPADERVTPLVDHVLMAGRIRAIILGNRIFLAIVGVLALLVALLGVANVMFVLVEERTREIGLRAALGALPGTLLRGQLFETLCISAVGGGLGLLLTWVVLTFVNALPLDPVARGYLGTPQLSLGLVALVAGGLGLAAGFAGYLPARRAAAISAVEALRHE